MNNFKKKYIKINVSDISGCINKNMYISRDVMVLKIWEDYDNESFKNAIYRNKLKIMKLSEMNKNIDNINKYNEYLLKYNESKNNMKNGSLDRPTIIKRVQNLYNIIIENNKNKYTLFINPKFSSNQLILLDIIINGFVNNFVKNNENEDKYIVDIKSRQKEMFNFIQEHEKIQIITCMRISNIKKCQHIEYFNGEIRKEFVEYDDKIWKEIEKGVFDFINYFEKIYCNNIFQDLFFIKKITNNSDILEMLASNLGYIIINDN